MVHEFAFQIPSFWVQNKEKSGGDEEGCRKWLFPPSLPFHPPLPLPQPPDKHGIKQSLVLRFSTWFVDIFSLTPALTYHRCGRVEGLEWKILMHEAFWGRGHASNVRCGTNGGKIDIRKWIRVAPQKRKKKKKTKTKRSDRENEDSCHTFPSPSCLMELHVESLLLCCISPCVHLIETCIVCLRCVFGAKYQVLRLNVATRHSLKYNSPRLVLHSRQSSSWYEYEAHTHHHDAE
jgi:hypothetical protein